VDEVDLAAALQLAQDRVAHEALVVLADERADRQAVLGRRGHRAQVAHAGQRHVEGARDGRRGERQHVHLAAQMLEALLVRYAEALLLVDDHEP